jgi:hypothetical protein
MENFMKVEPVLRFLKKNALAIPQYKLGDEPNHFFKTSEIAAKIEPALFRVMECEVTTHMIFNPIYK